MKFPYWFKLAWWLVLLAGTSFIIIMRYDAIIHGSSTPIDIFIIGIWIVLLFVPLFKEINVLGIKIRQDMNEMKNDLRDQIFTLRSEIQNTIDVSQQNIQHLYLGDMPTPRRLQEAAEKVDEKEDASIDEADDEVEVEDDTLELFKIRYEIESELYRIWQLYFQSQGARSRVRIPHIIGMLAGAEVIDDDIRTLVRDVYAVCSKAVHGDTIAQSLIDNVKSLGPKLIRHLKSID